MLHENHCLDIPTGSITAYASGTAWACGTQVSVKSSWIWGRCTHLFSQFRIFVGSTTAYWTNHFTRL